MVAAISRNLLTNKVFAQELVDCRITRIDNKEDGEMIRVQFESPVRGIAPGQVCCVYSFDDSDGRGRMVVGGGEILKSGQSYFDRGKELVVE